MTTQDYPNRVDCDKFTLRIANDEVSGCGIAKHFVEGIEINNNPLKGYVRLVCSCGQRTLWFENLYIENEDGEVSEEQLTIMRGE